MSKTGYDPSGYSNLLFHVEADALSLLFSYELVIFFHVSKILRFDKATYFSLLFKFALPERLHTNLCGSEVLLIFEFINIVSILYYIYCELPIFRYLFSNIFCSI